MIRLTDKMGICPAVNIINKQRNRNNPISPRTYSSPLLLCLPSGLSCVEDWIADLNLFLSRKTGNGKHNNVN